MIQGNSSEEIERLLSFTRQTRGVRDNSRLCYDWRYSGFCRHGNACRFMHSEEHAYTPVNYQNRAWSDQQAETSDRASSPRSTPQKEWNFSLMSYNILADTLAHEHAKDLYRAVPPFSLAWSHRSAHIIEEIKFWKPDVVCLQEVDHPDELAAALGLLNYSWALAPRTGDRTDGCMTFWKANKFALVRQDTLNMAAYNLRDNVALFTTLVPEGDGVSEHLATPGSCLSPTDVFQARGPPLVVANTHLLFNPKRGDIKLGQSRMILHKIVEICREVNMPPSAIFCGDFNSKPDSAIYNFVHEGELDCFMEDRRVLSGQLESDGKGWPTVGRPSSALIQKLTRPRGNSLDGPTVPLMRHLQKKMGAQSPPHHVNSMPKMAHLAKYTNDTSSPAERPLRIPHSFTNARPLTVDLTLDDENGRQATLTDPRRSQPVSLPGQATMYPHTDKYGQTAWSRVPPTHGKFKRQPFYHEPMVVEEAKPVTPPPPPAGIVRTVSFADRQMNAQTWTREQLMVATGIDTVDGVVPDATGNARSQMATPSASEFWVAEHPLPMQSSYQSLLGGEPEFTTCHSKFIGTVDYVWFTPEAGPIKLKPCRALLPPPLESLHCGLPSPEWPSDHISLLVNFRLWVD